MENSSLVIPNENEYTRFHSDTSTCDRKSLSSGFFDGFFGKFQDSFFYTGVIQYIIVTLMYAHIGKGKYWKILLYAATASLLGSLLENATVAYLCMKSHEEKVYSYVPTFLICELFWIPSEYAIPYLNLLKMKAFTKEKVANYIKYIILMLTLPFVAFRFLIGYERMMKGYLQSPTIHTYHGYAFLVMAVADILCTFCILHYVRKYKKRNELQESYASNYVRYSGYTTLISIDIVSSILSILNILINMGPFKDRIHSNYVTPLHCLKCSFILILATDALLFKYIVNTDGSSVSSVTSRTYGADNYNYSNINSRTNYRTNLYLNDNGSNTSINRNCIINIPSTHSSMDDIYTRTQTNNVVDSNSDIESPHNLHKNSLSSSINLVKYKKYFH